MDTTQIIFFIIDMIAIVIFLWFVLFGFIRGWKKSMLNAIAFLVPFFIIVLLSDVIAKSLIDINFFGLGSIKDLISSYVESVITDQGGLSDDTIIIVEGMAVAIMKIAIYVLAFTVAWLVSLILKLIFKLTLKRFLYGKEKIKRSPRMSERLIGLGTGAVRGILMVFIFFAPLMGVLNFADLFLQDMPIIQEITDTDDGATQMSKELYEINKLHEDINGSILYNVLNVGKGGDDGVGLAGSFFGSLISIKTEAATLNIVKEYGNLRQVFPVIKKVIETNEDAENIITLSNLTQEDINAVTNMIKNTEILKLVAPIVIDFNCNMLENEEGVDNSELIATLRSMELNKEIDIFASAINKTFETCYVIEINLDSPEDLLLEECLADNASEIFSILLDSILFEEILLPRISEELIESMGEEKGLENILTPENLGLFLRSDVETLLKVYQTMNTNNNLHNFIFHDEELVYDTEGAIQSLENSIIQLFNLSIIDGNESVLLEFVFDSLDEESLNYDVLFEGVNIDWDSEISIIASIVCQFVELKDMFFSDDFDIVDLLEKDENNKYKLDDLFNEVSKSNLLKGILVNFVDDLLEEDSEYEDIFEIIDLDKLTQITNEDVYLELVRILDMLDVLNEMNIFGEEEPVIDSESVVDIITLLFDSVLIEGNESSIIDYIIEISEIDVEFDQYGIELNLDNINWETEPDRFIELINAIFAFGDITEFDFEVFFGEEINENKDKIINLITAFDNSQIFGPSLEGLINSLLSETEYNISLSSDDFIGIRENTWNVEINNLVDVITYARDKIENITDSSMITGSEIKEIMIKASNTVIATKILGTALNDLLGVDGLNLNPVQGDGSYLYDFTISSTLRDSSNDIAALIDLKNSADSFDITNIDLADQNMDTIIDSLVQLENSTIANDMIGEILGEEANIDMSTIDVQKEAELVGDIYDVYKVNPDNFNLEDYPELQEKTEESELVDSILKLLGITKN